MAGHAQTARVRNAVPVNEQQIWLVREQLPGGHQRGGFTKGEKTGNVGHGSGDTRHLIFNQFKRGILQ
ncbi:hypothetical protein SDC9_145409 [bioreactor metagenome]|uniref:Uncharacterized protein n=1 Tax=bioreactor metagenome TaxID=1076179 RepID=A0A645E9T2_9ZZZZ